MTEPLLLTKLYVPPMCPQIVIRPRLIKRLNDGMQCKLTLLSAPAGFGKTTLVSEWFAGCQQPFAWVSLDDGDNDPARFLMYLISAVQTLYPKSCGRSLDLLHAIDLPPLSMLQTHLINELDLLPQNTIIVLDDYHVIHCNEIHEFIINLVNHMPARVHLVIISRVKPTFPISLWRARQYINEINTRDLCFTKSEAETFLKNTAGNSLTADMMKIIQDKAEGWAAGLQLAALSAKNAADPENFINSFQKFGSTDIREFLLNQIFESQPTSIQEFLLKTSILDRFTAPVCNALGLSGENLRNTQDTIDILCRANLFIVPLDEHGEWYRYHNLFGEMLQNRLIKQYAPDEISDLHRKASEWFEKNNFIDEAIQHALTIGDDIYAADIVEKHVFDALNQEQNAVIDRWLAALPIELVEKRPRLMMMRAWIESYREQGLSEKNSVYLLKTQKMLDTCQEEMDTETRILLDGYLSALWPFSLINVSKFELGVSLGERALRILPQDHYYVRGRALMGWALCMQALNKGEEATRFLLEERDSHPEVNAYTLVVLQALACIYSMSGKLDELEQTAASLYKKARAHGFQILTGWGDYLLGLAAYNANDLIVARQHFKNAASMQYLISKSIVRESMVGLCLVSQTLGKTDEAQAVANQLDELEYHIVNEYQRSLAAHLALIRNDLPTAQRWSLAIPESLPNYLLVWIEIPHFTQAHIWITDGRPEYLEKAIILLSELKRLAENMGTVRRVIESQIWLACAFYQQGKWKAALEEMERAVQLSQPRQFACLFIEAGPIAAKILRQISSNKTRFVQEVLSGFDLHIKKKETSHFLLTKREHEVLQMLDSHLSEREIADHLSVSLDTVKKHCYHIYNKLGVNRRRDAIETSKETGILP